MKTAVRKAVITLALVAGGLTYAAAAGAEPGSPPGETPLHLRPSAGDATPHADAASPLGAGWKLSILIAVPAAALLLWKKRSPRSKAGTLAPDLAIVRRMSTGVRSELVLIDIEGQRILLGVTPSSIQTLYIVPDSSLENSLVEPADSSTFARRLAGVIDPRETARPARESAVEKVAPEADVEEQVRGLMSLGDRR